MAKEYIEERSGAYYIVGKRVSLDSLVYQFLEGAPAESIQQSFPTLTLEEVYGGIAYYLAHRTHVDKYLEFNEAEYERIRREARTENPRLYARLEKARQNALLRRS